MNMPIMGGYFEPPDNPHYPACEDGYGENQRCICDDIASDRLYDYVDQRLAELKEE